MGQGRGPTMIAEGTGKRSYHDGRGGRKRSYHDGGGDREEVLP